MEKLQKICTEEGITVREAIQKLDAGEHKILIVTKQRKVTGIVTDGDVRRWILKKGSFDADISDLMCRNPKTIYEDQIENAKDIMVNARIDAIPVINDADELVDMIFIRDLLQSEMESYQKIDIPVVIMAGGKGTRLSPYTDILPKPLMPIGAKTILERIMDSFQKNGCSRFVLTLNYKKNLIKAYFDDKADYQISYVEEEDFYGTCGSLSLLKDKIYETFFLSNCDVLLDLDYAKLYKFHREHHNDVTAVTSLKHFQIPYGIFELEKDGVIGRISEKPEFNYQVNTGIYVLEPSVMEMIPEKQVYQMTDLLNRLMKDGKKVGAYPVTENCWKDMGELGEMQKMLKSYRTD